MKDTYIFPAIFNFADDGISIEFPDLPGCLPCAENEYQAFSRAKGAMQLHLYGMEKDGDEIPEPTPIAEIKTESNETVALIEVFMPPYREKMLRQKINRRIKIPKWLDEMARREKVDYSQFVEEKLKQYFGVESVTV